MSTQSVDLGDPKSILNICPFSGAKQSNKILNQQLDNYRVVVDIAGEALSHLQRGNLSRFDALVGENACQIRSAMIIDIYNQLNSSDVKKMFLDIENVQSRLLGFRFQGKETLSIRELLRKKELELVLPEKIQTVVMAYILTITKTSEDPIFHQAEEGFFFSYNEKTGGINALNKTRTVTRNFALELDFLVRKMLAAVSVQYVQGEARLCLSKDLELSVSDQNIQEVINRKALPCFASMQVLLERIALKRTPFVVKIFRMDIEKNFKVDEVLLRFNFQKEKSAAFIFEGFNIQPSESPGDLQARIKQVGIQTIILGNAASHGQFPRSCKSQEPVLEPKSVKERRLTYIEVAKEKGFCQKNADLFVIDHIFCETLSNLDLKNAIDGGFI